jgi:hypothetical protein
MSSPSELIRLLRKLDIELLGVEADSKEALGFVRSSRAEKDLTEGLQAARGTLDQLLGLAREPDREPVSEVKLAAAAE